MNPDPAGRRPLSLNTRVMLFVAVAITISMLVIGYLVRSTVARHFDEQDAGELRVITHAVEDALETATIAGQPPEDALGSATSGHHGVYFQVWDEQGQLIYGPPELQPPGQADDLVPAGHIDIDSLHRWATGEKTFHVAITQTRINARQYRIVAAIDMGFHLRFMESFNYTLWFIMTLAGAITLLAAWFGVHRGHAPLRTLSETMEDIQSDRLDVRLDAKNVPAELITLVDSFNHMISRLEDSFVKLSNFSADIAHELRTPLTNLITQTQVGLGKSRSSEEYKEFLYSNLEELEHLAKMVNDMLWLAQSENGLLRPHWESVELTQEVKETADFFEALAEEKNVRFHVEGGSAHVSGDRSMLRHVVSNLLSNAIRFTPEGEEILVQVTTSGREVVLKVENPGPTIAEEHLPKLFDRFYQLDDPRQRQGGGAGLGLAIARSIVTIHDGTITASSKNGRTCFTILFPGAH